MLRKVTFTLDDQTIERLCNAAERLKKPKSEIVRDAVADYHERIGKLSEAERLRLLKILERMRSSPPTRPQAEVDREIAEILNQNGWRTWEAKPFNLKKIAWIRCAYKLASRYDRLRRRGMLTTREVAAKFKISETTVRDWGRQGLGP